MRSSDLGVIAANGRFAAATAHRRPLDLAVAPHGTLELPAFAATPKETGPQLPPRHRPSLDNLALVLNVQGDLDGARPLLERALAIYEARLGSDHPDTVRTQQSLAAVVTKLDDRS